MAERTRNYQTRPQSIPGVEEILHPRGIQEIRRTLLAYDPRFDIQAYRQLANLAGQLPQEELQRRKSQLGLRTRHNLETVLGERFNVEISQVSYSISLKGELINPDHDEPFLEIVRRGREYRQQFANRDDCLREEAEVAGFEKVQEILATRNQQPGTRIVVISPKGNEASVYQHNFFDIYQKEGHEKVKMSRYTSRLSHHEFWGVARKLDPTLPTPLEPTDAYFLSRPIATDKSLDQILGMFSPDENTMPRDTHQRLLQACEPLINAYIDNPSHRTYNAILNFADGLVLGSDPQTAYPDNHLEIKPPQALIDFYGSLPVRPVSTGCGVQSGFTSIVNGQLSIVNFLPFSVSEFALNYFHCPGCGGQIESGRGITTCPHCGLTKEQAGSKC